MSATPYALVVQHHPLDTPGAIAGALRARGVEPRDVRGFAGDAVPASIGDAAALVVMGGPMSVEDEGEHPFLALEARLIASAVDARVPVLGVCLGAQLVARALGGSVRRGAATEIGWFPVELTPAGERDAILGALPARFVPFHWHDDAIVAPPGAEVLARSSATPVQAFRVGERVLGVQFHLECDRAMIDATVAAFGSEGAPDAGDASRIATQERLAAGLFGRWAESVR